MPLEARETIYEAARPGDDFDGITVTVAHDDDTPRIQIAISPPSRWRTVTDTIAYLEWVKETVAELIPQEDKT